MRPDFGLDRASGLDGGRPVTGPPIHDDPYTITLFTGAGRRDWQVRVADRDRVESREVGYHESAAVMVERIVAAVRYGKLELAGIRHLLSADDPWADPDPATMERIEAFVHPAVAARCALPSGGMTIASTDRLVVRDWTETPQDLDRIYDIYSREEVMRWLGGGRGRLTDPAEAVERLHTWRERFDRYAGRWGIWAIEPRTAGRAAGSVLLKPLPGPDGVTPTDDIEVGWHLHPDSQGHGYATEAARAVLDREFAAGTRQVYAVVMAGNDASMAVARRLGMTHVGVRTEWYGGEELETFVLHRSA